MKVTIRPSPRKGKKHVAIFEDGTRVHFGATGYSDYTKHKDPARKKRYIARHVGEKWGKSGMKTAGFWSRWLLWNKPTLKSSASDIKKRFNISVRF